MPDGDHVEGCSELGGRSRDGGTVTAMSKDASENRPWPTTPNFGASPRGYWGYEVDRLLSELKAADEAGESLGPIIDERKLSEVGFGYSMPEVDAHLALLRGRTTSNTTAAFISPQTETLGADLGGTPMSGPVGMESSAEPEPVRGGVGQPASSVAACMPPSGPGAIMLAEIKKAEALPRPPGRAAGYAAADVDKFFSDLANAIRADQYVVPTLQRARFDMARGGAPGYDVKEVDLLLDRLERLASGPVGAPELRAYQPNPYDQRDVERNPYRAFSTPTKVKPGRSKSILRTVIWTAFMLFFRFNFIRVSTGFGF